MRTTLWIGLGIFVVVALVVAGLTAGWALWGRQLWAAAPSYALGTGSATQDCEWESGRGPAMMPGRATPWGTPRGPACVDDAGRQLEPPGLLTIDEAHEDVKRYLASVGYDQLEVVEVMEFELNFYAIAREPDTGIGAMELLLDKGTGAVGPEMGPNMMWNARYGMRGRGTMMGGSSGRNAISDAEALAIAQRWLDANRPGVTVEEHAVPFYGYYTVHTLEDGEIEGMLSVHGTTGQVWYHTWHGAFAQMIESEDAH
ncbi:MAG: hypothetical protein R6X31_04465 [Anaerolineae bacterium]